MTEVFDADAELEKVKEKKELMLKEQQKEQENYSGLAHDEIQDQYEKNRRELSKNEDFQRISREIVERGAKAELTNDMLQILTTEQKNELSAYILQCEKQKLDFRKKKEKGVILEEVKAEVSAKKIEALKKRYGYLYEKDANGEPKNFIANKMVNKYKEFCNWWDGTTDGFKRVVKGFLKAFMWVGIGSLVVLLGYRFFMWVAENSQNIPNIN